MARWVQIRRLLSLEGALVERSVLEAAGLSAWSPDILGYAAYPQFSDVSRSGYRLFVLDAEVEQAREVLNCRDEDEGPSYPCPTCGGKTRRLKSISGTLALTWLYFLMQLNLDFFLTLQFLPVRRRKRICNGDRTRFMPEPVELFTDEELGWSYARENVLSTSKRMLEAYRDIGLDPPDDEDGSKPR